MEPNDADAVAEAAGLGMFDAGAVPSAARDREDQLMEALVVLRSDVDTLRIRLRVLYVAVGIVIAVLLAATAVVR